MKFGRAAAIRCTLIKLVPQPFRVGLIYILVFLEPEIADENRITNGSIAFENDDALYSSQINLSILWAFPNFVQRKSKQLRLLGHSYTAVESVGKRIVVKNIVNSNRDFMLFHVR